MEMVQKKKSIKHTFNFKDDYFNFAYEDKSGSGDADINYVDFPQKASIQIEQNEWLRNVGYLWCTLGVFQLGHAIYSNASVAGKGFWLIVGLACVLWAYFSKVKYSVFKTESGNVFVIHDNLHDKIVNELNARRKKQLLEWYGEVNHENDLRNEIGKFKWLVEQGAISKEESAKKIAQAELLQKEFSQGQQLN